MATVFRQGRVIDPSTGTDGRLDVLVDGDRVVACEPRVQIEGAVEVDAAGMWVLPGFIDAHTHSDFTITSDPAAPARISQGFTTDVTGNCGFSPFPLKPGLTEFGSFFGGRPVSGHADLRSYAEEVAASQPAINIAPLAGLGSIRRMVMGALPGHPTAQQTEQMQFQVGRALDQGAFGISSGLVYVPGMYSSQAEIVEILRPLGRVRGLYVTHLRDERDGLVAAVREAIETAEAIGANLQISHHKALGSKNWGATQQTLALIDDVNARGEIDVTLDYYPYTSGSTGISSLLPPGAIDEGWAVLRKRLTNEPFRRSLVEHLATSAQFRPDEVVIGRSKSWPEISGQRVADIATREGLSPADVLVRLIKDEGERLTMVVPAAGEQDLQRVMAHPSSMHGSDAWLMTKAQAKYEHPRNLGSTAGVLARAASGQLTLSQAVEHLTTRPARRLGVTGRGTIAPGSFADVVVIDPARIALQADRVRAYDYPDMVRWALVNGVPVIADGSITGQRPGRVLQAK